MVGLPGDTIELREGTVRINGTDIDESYLDPRFNVSPKSQAPVYVRPNYYFVMGDNRDNSSDSRSWGLVPKKYVYGKALFRYWPITSASIIHHEDMTPVQPGMQFEEPGNTPAPSGVDVPQ